MIDKEAFLGLEVVVEVSFYNWRNRGSNISPLDILEETFNTISRQLAKEWDKLLFHIINKS